MLAAKTEVEEGQTEDIRRQGALRANALLRTRARIAASATNPPAFKLDDNAVNTAVLNERFVVQSSQSGELKPSTARLRKSQNGEAFFLTFALNEIKCNLNADDAPPESEPPVILSLSLSSLSVSLRGRTHDLRAKVILETFHFGDGDICYVKSYKCGPSGESLMFPDFEPPLMMNGQGDLPFFRIIMEKSRRGDKGSRLKVDIGGLETSLEKRGIQNLVSVASSMLISGKDEIEDEVTPNNNAPPSRPPRPPRATAASPAASIEESKKPSSPLAISVKFNSILVKLLNESRSHIFSSILSNLELRVAKTDTRRQIDVILGGARFVDEGEIGRGAKQQAMNGSIGSKNLTRSHFSTRLALSPTDAIIIIHHPNPFRDSLRSSQFGGTICSGQGTWL